MDARELVEAWFDMCARGDAAAADRLATDDYVTHGPGGTDTLEGFKKWLDWYPRAFADQQWHLDEVIACGARIIVRYTTTSTYRGGFLDLPAADQRVTECGIMILGITGDRVSELWFQANDLEIAQQLGATFT